MYIIAPTHFREKARFVLFLALALRKQTLLFSPSVLRSEQLKQYGYLGKKFYSHYRPLFSPPSEHLLLKKRPRNLGTETHSFSCLFSPPSFLLLSLPSLHSHSNGTGYEKGNVNKMESAAHSVPWQNGACKASQAIKGTSHTASFTGLFLS